MNASSDWLSKDGKLLLAAKIIRTFCYGFLSVILAIYLKLIGFSEPLIGVVLTTTIINSIIFTLIASFYADKIGRQRILIIYAALMSVSGAIFLTTVNQAMLIIAAFIGSMNVTGSETGAFLSIEQAILPQTIKNARRRNMLFAIYNMVGTFSMAAGILLLSGFHVILGQKFDNDFLLTQINSIRSLFILYSVMSIIVAVIYFLLSNKIEVQVQKRGGEEGRRLTPLKQTLSPKSRKIVAKLSGLFAVDSFAGGFIIQSIVSFWFFTKFEADLTTLSYIFSIAGVLTALSFIVSSKIADKIGLINTMVFTHIPSNILIMLVAVAPTLPVAIALYLARMALSQMDVPTRQSYIVAVVREEERTAAAGITNISRNIAQAVSPSITGVIINSLTLSAPFVIGGLLKIAYDIAIYINFRKIKPHEEEEER
jgi:MFS family permease